MNQSKPSRSKLQAFIKRQERQLAIREFEKQFNKETVAEARRPWFIKQREYGDYHYEDWDMEPREEG